MGWLGDLLFGSRATDPPVRQVVVGLPAAGWSGSVSGVTAIGLSSVWRCLDILSNGVSQLPWRELRGNLELFPSRIVRRPHSRPTRREWVSFVVSTLALYDVAYLLKTGPYDSEGVISGLLPIDPNQVMPTSYSANQVLSPFIEDDWYYVGTARVPRDELVILRRSPTAGLTDATGGVIRLARATFAGNLAAEDYASRYWQGGGNPVVALETDAHLNQGEANEVADRWAERRAKGPDYAPVLSGGIKAHPFGADPTAESAVEARREMVADVGRYFGVPTRILNAPTGDSVTYASAESGNQDLVRYTLQNYIGAIEDAISDQLPGGRRMSMDTRRLVAGTLVERAQATQLATGRPWMDVDEARETWDLAPLEGPSPLTAAPAPPALIGGGANGGA